MANTIIKYNNTQIAEVAPDETTTLDTKDKWLSSRIEIISGGNTTVKYDGTTVAEIGTDETTTLDTKDKWVKGRIEVETESAIVLLPIGGRVFYDDGDNGATYTFYDASGNKITDTSISGLANATQYSVIGTPTKDRFYVFDNTSHTTGGKTASSGLVASLYWGYYRITTGATSNSIGSGKSNTNNILAITDTSEYADSIFKYIKACRDANLNNCNDWFVLSMAEHDKLNRSGLADGWYWSSNVQNIWSSVEDEDDSEEGYYWFYDRKADDGSWYSNDKSIHCYCFAARSF